MASSCVSFVNLYVELQYRTPKVGIPQTPSQVVSGVRAHLHAMNRVSREQRETQLEAVEGALKWLDQVIPGSALWVEPLNFTRSGNEALLALRAEIETLRSKLAAPGPISMSAELSKLGVFVHGALHTINKIQGRKRAQRIDQVVREQRRIAERNKAWDELKEVFVDRRPESIENFKTPLEKAQALIRKIRSLEKDISLDRLEAIVEYYLNKIPELKEQPLTDISLRMIWEHFREQTQGLWTPQFRIQGLSVLRLAKAEIEEYVKEEPKNRLRDIMEWTEMFNEHLVWWLGEISTTNRLHPYKDVIIKLFREIHTELRTYEDNLYLASPESLYSLREFIVSRAKRIVRTSTFDLADRAPKLERVPRNDDPGDNPNIAAHRLFLEVSRSLLEKMSTSTTGLAHTLDTLHSTLHWLARLPVGEDAQAIGKAISKEAISDRNSGAFRFGIFTEGITKKYDGTGVNLRSYRTYYETELSKLEESLPEQTYSGMKTPVGERLARTIEMLRDYVDYLKDGEWDFANIMEINLVGAVALAQFIYVKEFFRNPAAVEITEHMSERFKAFTDAIGTYATQAEKLNFEKEIALKSFENFLDSLELVTRLEDPTYEAPERTIKLKQATRHKSVEDWNDNPLSFKDWIEQAPRSIRDMAEADQSAQWAMYVFGVKTIPTKSDRNSRTRELSKIFHPDMTQSDRASHEHMQTVAAAKDILELHQKKKSAN